MSIFRKTFGPKRGALSILQDEFNRVEEALRALCNLQSALAERLDRMGPSLGAVSDVQTALRERLDLMNEHTAERLDRLNARLSQVGYAASLASKIGYKGDEENLLYRTLIGAEKPLSCTAAPVPLSSSLCQQVHFSLDQYRFWVEKMKDKPKYMRKQWEFFYIAQALFERDMLRAGRKGLGFGVGLEPLPALFASLGVEILATDQSYEHAKRAGWVRSNEHSTDLSGLNARGICTEAMFDRLVRFAEVDMNALPVDLRTRFDFCWSACALEHLGSLKHGAEFIKKSLDVLRPGGVAVHTTEFNLSSDERTIESEQLSVYRRCDIEKLAREIESEGHTVEPIDWTHGSGLAEAVVDLPPWGRGEPHLRLLLGDFECTSIALVVQRNAV